MSINLDRERRPRKLREFINASIAVCLSAEGSEGNTELIYGP
jgi:hypothetical protein